MIAQLVNITSFSTCFSDLLLQRRKYAKKFCMSNRKYESVTTQMCQIVDYCSMVYFWDVVDFRFSLWCRWRSIGLLQPPDTES